MAERDRPVVDIQKLVGEDIMEVRRDEDFGASGTTSEEMLQYTAEKTGAVFTEVRGGGGTEEKTGTHLSRVCPCRTHRGR